MSRIEWGPNLRSQSKVPMNERYATSEYGRPSWTKPREHRSRLGPTSDALGARCVKEMGHWFLDVRLDERQTSVVHATSFNALGSARSDKYSRPQNTSSESTTPSFYIFFSRRPPLDNGDAAALKRVPHPVLSFRAQRDALT